MYTGGENDPKTTLDNEIIDPNLRHKNYFYNAEYWLDMNGADWMEGAENLGSAEDPLPLAIKGRGNWTLRGFVKKPYKLKLGKKARMLGLSNSKHFAILAHADDNAGYLRNYVGFNLGKRAGLPWTPSQQPVEVVINGNYRGLYFLTESIRVESDRIDIEELDDNVDDMAYVTGGYVMEFDNYADDAVWSATGGNAVWHDGHNFPVYLTPDTPEAYSAPQLEFVSSQFDRMNSLVGDHNPELWSYLDIDDAVRYYMVEEIISHYEAYHGSTYLFRDRGEDRKWHFSPLWDCGHAFEGGTSNFFYESPLSMGNTWIRCLKDTPGFESRLKETWLWFMSTEAIGLMSDIDTYCGHIAEAAKADRERWKNAGRPQYTDGWEAWEVQDNSDIEARKNQVLTQLNAKLAWLRGQ
ncbi:MAG: CotH kinase family protein, partial [Muribaculaceae bacterium]|nr:CotH kinase family protein [Muribaculaceae bacterium]